MFETPVVFTIFNRPTLTARVLEVLRVVQPATLFVIADGPRADHPDDAERCAAARALIDQIDWPCQLEKRFHATNLGVGKCISEGILWVFEQVESAIFVEDDTLPDPSFFPFCAAMLEKYRDDPRVAMIQGTNVLGSWTANGASYFFSRFGPLWGWASWRRTWRDYDPYFRFMDAPDFEARLAARLNDPAYTAFLMDLCTRSRRDELDSWDTQITVQQILRGDLCVVAAVNPIQNLGFGSDGVHTRQRFALGANLEHYAIPFPLVSRSTVAADDEYDRRFMALTLGNPPFNMLCARIEHQLDAARYSPALLWITRALQQDLATTDTERAELQVLYARALYGLNQPERAHAALGRALVAVPEMPQALALRRAWQNAKPAS